MVVIAGKPGQLGNMLLLSAHFIAGALEYGYGVANPAFDAYARHFVGTRGDVFCRFPPRATLFSGSRQARRLLFSLAHSAARAGTFLGDAGGPLLRVITLPDWQTVFGLNQDWFIKAAQAPGLLFVRGWLFRDSDTLAKHAPAVRAFFQPLDRHREAVARLIDVARARADVLVGVHMRQGYRDLPEHKRYWYGGGQYVEIMRRVERLFPDRNVTFLICSDEPLPGQLFAGFRTIFGLGTVVEDLHALAECHYILGPPSTFSMWASFYGGAPLYTIVDPGREPTLADFRAAVI